MDAPPVLVNGDRVVGRNAKDPAGLLRGLRQKQSVGRSVVVPQFVRDVVLGLRRRAADWPSIVAFTYLPLYYRLELSNSIYPGVCT